MVNIVVQPDCGNAPKKELLRDFTIAFPKQQASFLLDNIADEIQWEMVGDKLINGKIEAEKSINAMMDDSIKELVIKEIITHGDTGSVNGTMEFKDGSKFAFCDIYKFTSHAKDAKIKEITSFIIALKS